MITVSATRLRIRRRRFLLPFFARSFRIMSQARRAPGYVTGTILNDRDRAFWTLTAWESGDAMRAFRNADPHRAAMAKLDWCDEMAYVRWEQESRELPTWEEAHRRLVADGRTTRLAHASEAHLARRVPPPVGTGAPPMGPKA